MSEAEAGARKAVDDFFIAFNALDGEAMKNIQHYPHVMIADKKVFITKEPSDYIDYTKNLPEREGWHHSKVESLEAIHVSEDKVHFKIEFARYKEDGEKYAHYLGIWIFTREDDHWGLLARSIYSPR